MSQQQNPHEGSQSLQKSMELDGNNGGTDLKPFSIRQYVLASRQKDMFQSWPFPEKYLHICLKHGINNVLPPLEPHHLAIQSLRRSHRRSNCSQQNKENVGGSYQEIHQITVEQEKLLKEGCNLNSEETVSKICNPDFHLSFSYNTYEHEENDPQLSSDVASANMVSRDQPSTNIPSSLHVRDPCDKIMNSTKRLWLKRKRHKGKGKHKKKSIVDVLAVAKPCTPEKLCIINSLCNGLRNWPLEDSTAGTKQITKVERSCESELTEEGLNDKHQADDSVDADNNMLGRKGLVVKFKFSGCSSTS
ncbi:hypothetical protein PanWU01x14_106680 [Parasponia andersonii]|uniref:Uncharacterized protein n=1 Tax=Parasponia andersonii TaxID=3476 RepID=A0A2P5D0Q6_PARAD|nr:hypothetical protein PanWU01x14_106680 [Parasponia andersonii]